MAMQLETGWLVEDVRNRVCLGVSGQYGYYLWVLCTSPNAIRFSRREDAQRTIEAMRKDTLHASSMHSEVIPMEHVWIRYEPALYVVEVKSKESLWKWVPSAWTDNAPRMTTGKAVSYEKAVAALAEARLSSFNEDTFCRVVPVRN